MTIDLTDLEAALDDVEHAARLAGGHGDFVRHRPRYASDAGLLARVHDGSRVLEVGAFPGHFTALLALLGVDAVAVDVAPRRMAAFTQAFALDVRACDVEREPLPFADGTFRTVICNEVFEHLRVDPLFALSELNRVIAPDGCLLLTTPNLYAVQQIARFLAGRGIGDPLAEFDKLRSLGHMGHVREYSHREMRRFLAFAGFELEHSWFRHYYFGAGRRGLAKRLAFALAPARLRSFQVLLARKRGASPGLSPLPGPDDEAVPSSC